MVTDQAQGAKGIDKLLSRRKKNSKRLAQRRQRKSEAKAAKAVAPEASAPVDSKHDAPKMDDQQTAKLRKKNLAHKLKKRALKAACKAANHAVGLPRNVASSSHHPTRHWHKEKRRKANKLAQHLSATKLAVTAPEPSQAVMATVVSSKGVKRTRDGHQHLQDSKRKNASETQDSTPIINQDMPLVGGSSLHTPKHVAEEAKLLTFCVDTKASDYVIVKQPAKTPSVCDRPEQGLQEQLHPQPPQDEDGPQEHPHVRSHEHVHSVAQPQEGHHGQFKVSCEAQSQSASLLPPILTRPQEASASSYDMDMGDMGFDQNLHQVADLNDHAVHQAADVTEAEVEPSPTPTSLIAAIPASDHAAAAQVAQLLSQQQSNAVSVPVTEQPTHALDVEAGPPAATVDRMGSLDAKEQHGASALLAHHPALDVNVVAEKVDAALPAIAPETHGIGEGLALQAEPSVTMGPCQGAEAHICQLPQAPAADLPSSVLPGKYDSDSEPEVPRLLQKPSSELSNEGSTCQQDPTTSLAMPILGSHARLVEGQTAHQHDTPEACQVVIAAAAMATLDGNSNQQARVLDGPIAQPRQTFGIEHAEPASYENAALKNTARAGSLEDRPSHAAQAAVEAIEEVDYDAWYAIHGFKPGQGVVLEEMWGWPNGPQPPQPFRQQMETSMWGSHYARYNSFMERPRAHGLQCPKGTAKPLQGLFLLLRAFESITDTNVQRSILQHSLQLKDLSEGSRVQLLRHEIQSANELMKVLRCCSPKTTKDDHIMMLQGPSLDISLRESAMVRNEAVRFHCDQQSKNAWMEGPKTNTATTADFCDSGGAAEMAIQAMFPPMQGWADALKVEWGLRAENPLDHSCVVEAFMATWVNGNLPSSVANVTIPYAHQVDICKMESCLGPRQQGVGPSLCASLNAPLPRYGADPQDEAVISAGFPYTPHAWSSKSVTGLTCCDDGWGALMARCHQDHQLASTIYGVTSAMAIVSTMFTRTNFHVEDGLLGAINLLCHGSPKIWYAVPAEKAACFEAALRQLHGDQALASLTAKHMYRPLPMSLLKELGVKRFLQMPGYAVLTYSGVVYHWTISTGFSLAEATNVCVCESWKMAENLCQWYTKLEKACAEARDKDLKQSLLQRADVTQAIMTFMVHGPLSVATSPALHTKAMKTLEQLRSLTT